MKPIVEMCFVLLAEVLSSFLANDFAAVMCFCYMDRVLYFL